MMAQAVVDGASKEPSTSTQLLHAGSADFNHVLEADGYIFITPETLGSMAGQMKDFFDRTYYHVLDRIQARPYSTLICAGSDGSNAARQIQRIATGWRLNPIAEPLIVCTHAQTPEDILRRKIITEVDLQRCRDLGENFATGLAMGLY